MSDPSTTTDPRVLNPAGWYTTGNLFTALGIDPARVEAARQAGIIVGVPTGSPNARGNQLRPESLLFSGTAIHQWLCAGAPVTKQAR